MACGGACPKREARRSALAATTLRNRCAVRASWGALARGGARPLSIGGVSGEHPAYGLADLQADLRDFTTERDWRRFHDPKSLVLALVGEVGELAELMQWVPADEAQALFSTGRAHERVGEEMSDVLIYLLGLAEVLELDLLTAARAKLAAARLRYPADAAGGLPKSRI